MRQQEQRLWDRMRNNRPLDVRLERVENGAAEGTPDVLALVGGVVSWVELKARTIPPIRAETPLLGEGSGANAAQRNWHLDWRRNGGRSFFLVGTGRGAGAQQWLLPGALHDELNGMSMAAIQHAALAAAWTEIFARLRSR